IHRGPAPHTTTGKQLSIRETAITRRFRIDRSLSDIGQSATVARGLNHAAFPADRFKRNAVLIRRRDQFPGTTIRQTRKRRTLRRETMIFTYNGTEDVFEDHTI